MTTLVDALFLYDHPTEAVADWLATNPSREAKQEAHRRLVDHYGWAGTIRIWHDGLELARRRATTCPSCGRQATCTYLHDALVVAAHGGEA